MLQLKRATAIQWWNNLASLRKTQICDTNTELIGGIRRWETLTGSEIENLYDIENQPEYPTVNTEDLFENDPTVYDTM